MRRIPRLRRPCGLANSTSTTRPCNQPLRLPQTSSTAPSSTRAASSKRTLKTSAAKSARPGRFGASWPSSDDPAVPSPPLSAPEPPAPGGRLPSLTMRESLEVDEIVDDQFRQEAVLPLPPRQRTIAPRQDEVSDGTYQPARSGEGLPEIATTDDWFAEDQNWDPESRLVGFAPAAADKVQDARVLEVLIRRAVVEALAMRKATGKNMCSTWAVGTRDDLLRTLSCELVVHSNGVAQVKGPELDAVVEALGQEQQQEDEWDEGGIEDETPADIETSRRTLSMGMGMGELPFITSDEAREMCKGWSSNWKNISLEHIKLKFAVTKRVYQLTGHRMHDYKLHSILSVGALIKAVQGQARPRPVKLAEVLPREAPDLTDLPNVKVFDRRITPIDKEKMVGRWKVIERELERRGLPATGHEQLPKPNMRSWLLGKA